MTSQFGEPRHGRGPRTGRSALALCGCLIGVGVSYSRIFYPQPLCSPKPESALRVKMMQLEEIPDTARAADLCRRILKAQSLTAAARKERRNDTA